MDVTDKVALITGATGALGSAVTKAFLDAQTHVAIAYRSEEALKALEPQLDQFRSNVKAINADVLQDAQVQSLIDEVIDEFGRVDFLINIVGGFLGGVPIAETAEQQWDDMMNLNLKSAFLCSRNSLPHMIEQKFGRIINIGAKAGLQAVPGMSAYSASKAGLINFTQTLAVEGREYNIRANIVIPSIIDTAENRTAMPQADYGNWVKPGSIARIILFLCSDEADDISGAVIPVYGKV